MNSKNYEFKKHEAGENVHNAQLRFWLLSKKNDDKIKTIVGKYVILMIRKG